MPTPPDTPRGFEDLQPLLWHVVGALARAGVVASPDESRDLLHDFFIEAWPGVQRNHDPSRASFETYLFAAFYRYARRRIIELHTWQKRLVGLDAAAHLPTDAPGPEDAAAHAQHLTRLRDALAHLPALERTLVLAYAGGDGNSERLLAERHGFTRHTVRTALARAMATLAARLQEALPAPRPEQPSGPRPVRAPQQRAPASPPAGPAGAGRTERTQPAYTSALLASVREHHGNRRGRMTALNAHIEMLAAALRAPGDTARLADVRSCAVEIRAALESDDTLLAGNAFAGLAHDTDWVGEVYAALAPPHEWVQRTLDAALEQVRSDRTAELRDAYLLLLGQLGPAPLDHAFDGVPALPDAVQRQLAHESGLDAADSVAAADALRFGITPFALAGAARGMTLLLDRVARRLRQPDRPGRLDDCIRTGDRLEFDPSHELWLQVPGASQAAVLPVQSLQVQVAGAAHVTAAAAAALTHWLLQLLRDFPYVVEGYALDPSGHGFQPAALHFADVSQRWCARAEPVQLEAMAMAAAPAVADEQDDDEDDHGNGRLDRERQRGMGML